MSLYRWNMSNVIASRISFVLAFLLSGACAILAAQVLRYLMVSELGVFQKGMLYATYHDFRIIHLEVSYFEHGYLRRGFIGTVFHALGIGNVLLAGWLLSLGAILFFLGLVGFVAAEVSPARRRLLYVVLGIMVFGPAGVVQFVTDAGRIDHPLLPLLAVAMIAGMSGRLAISAGLFGLMCLIHELSVIAFTPVLVVSNILGSRHGVRLDILRVPVLVCWRSVAVFATIALAVVTMTVLYGDSAQAVRAFADTGDTRRLYSNMVWGGNSPVHMVEWTGLPSLLLVVYYLALAIWAGLYCRTLSGAFVLLPAAAGSCVLLNLLGVDAGRWAAIFTWVIVATIVATEFADRRTLADRTVSPTVLYAGLLMAAPVGPIGVTVPFTFAAKLIGLIGV